MNRIIQIVWQTLVICIVGTGLGFLVNAFSADPLPFVRQPLEVEKWPTVDAETVYEHVQNGSAILIDARDPHEYEAGHIPGALLLPASEFNEYFQAEGEALPRDYPLVVYCQGGDCEESHEVLQELENEGFQELYSYIEGWNGWKKTNYPKAGKESE